MLYLYFYSDYVEPLQEDSRITTFLKLLAAILYLLDLLIQLPREYRLPGVLNYKVIRLYTHTFLIRFKAALACQPLPCPRSLVSNSTPLNSCLEYETNVVEFLYKSPCPTILS